jgi:hypothetical protein
VKLVHAPVAPHVIEKGLPTTGVLAQVLVAKFADHLPLCGKRRSDSLKLSVQRFVKLCRSPAKRCLVPFRRVRDRLVPNCPLLNLELKSEVDRQSGARARPVRRRGKLT